MALREKMRWLATWLIACLVSFFALSARADVPPPHITEPTVGASAGRGLVKKDGFGGLAGSGQVTGGTSGRLPTTGSGQQTNPGAASGSGQLTISGSVEVAGAASPSIADRIGNLFSQADDLVEGAIDSDVGRIVGATLVNPVAGVLTFAGQQMEADGARTGDGNKQVAGALTSMPGDFGQGILNVGYDTIKGLGGLVVNGVETQVRVAAAGVTGNEEAFVNAMEDSQLVNLGQATGSWVADNIKTEASIVAAVSTGNTAALTNALRDSQTVQFVTDAANSGGDRLAEIRQTITNGTAAERAELIHSTGRVAGEVTAEVAMVLVPGGGGVRVASTAGRVAPTVVKAEEALAGGARVARAPELAGAARGEELAGRSALDDVDLVPNCKGELCRPGTSSNCFAAGTPVLTPDGERPIESVRVGDVVLSRDPETFELGLHRVARTFVTPEREVAELDLESDEARESFVVTLEHPFFVEGRGFKNVIDLAPGDVVVTATGTARVERLVTLPRATTVYNFEVEKHHTYFVGHTGAWVHNDCAPLATRPGDEVLVPRSDGSISTGRVRGTTPDGRVIVEVPGGGIKTVDPRTLTRPKPPRAFGDPYGSIEDGYANLGSRYFRSHLATHSDALPAEGWKLHVSASTAQSYAVADRVLPVLRQLGVHHKIVTDPAMYAKLTGTQTGKFITIYPANAAEARRVVEALRPVLGPTTKDAPIIMGEQALGNGIYTRYGGFTKSTVTGPDGREIPDVRGQISPPWVPFPF